MMVVDPSLAKAEWTYYGGIGLARGYPSLPLGYGYGYGYYGWAYPLLSPPAYRHDVSYQKPALSYWQSQIPAIEKQIAMKIRDYEQKKNMNEAAWQAPADTPWDGLEQPLSPQIQINPRDREIAE